MSYLGEVVKIILGGTPRTTKPEFWDGEIPWITPADIGNTKHIVSTGKTITKAGLHGSNTKLLEIGDVVISARGSVGKIVECDKPMAFNQSCYALRPKKQNILEQAYLYYLLQQCVGYLRQNSAGAVFNAIVKKTLETTPVILPSLASQKRISSILSTYDDLIENNQRRIQLLEESARLLYKEWFVQLRFPGYELTKIIDSVPDGWKHKSLIEVADLTMGQSPKSEFYNDVGDGLPFHQGVTNYGNRFVTHKIYSTKITRLAEAGDILCSVRAPVGRLNYTLDKIVLGRGLSAISSKGETQSFLFYQLKNYFFKEDIIGSGAIYASVTKKDITNLQTLLPPKNIIRSFEKISNPIDKQIVNLSVQNQKLAQARDLLLPRLMNGEVEP